MNLKLELSDIYGGDGFTRVEKIKVPRLQRKKVKTSKREGADFSVSQSTTETKFDEVETDIQTFKTENDKYYLRLGGIHGKLWGAMKAAGNFLKETDDEDFPTMAATGRAMNMINITPVIIELENPKDMRVEQMAQIINTISKSMIIQRFDVIGKCEANITIQFPDLLKPKVVKMLKQAEMMSCFNKRRGSFKVIEGLLTTKE